MTRLKRCLLVVGLVLLLPGTTRPAQAQGLEEGWQTYTTADGLADNRVETIAKDGGGRWWFGTQGGASVLDDGGTPFDKGDDTWTTFTTADGLAGNIVYDIAEDDEGRWWFGTWGGVSVLDDAGTPFDKGDDTWAAFTESDGLARYIVLAIAANSEGRWWFGTDLGGVSVLDDGGTPFDKRDDTWTTFTTADGLAGNSVVVIAEDGGERLWFGTYGGGVSVLDDGGTPFDKGDDTWATFTNADGLADNYVRSIAQDSEGRLWFGTSGGASVMDDGGTPFDKGDDTWATFNIADGLAHNIVQAIAVDGGRRLWFGTSGGASVLDDGGTPFDNGDDTWVTFTATDGLPDDSVEAIAVGGGGRLWFGTRGGVGELVDAVAPASSASSPEYANGMIPVPWSASDGASTVFGVTLWVKYGSGGTWTDTGQSQRGEVSGMFSYTPTQGDGTYYFATVAEDWMGNTEATPADSGDDSTVYDTTDPSSNASAPDYDSAGDTAVSWAASDATSGVTSTALWVKCGSGGSWGDTGLSTAGTSGIFNYTPTQGDGTYYFATVATDYAGNAESTPTGSGDDSTVYDTTAPTAIASSPATTTEYSFLVSWSGDDATSGVADYDVQYRVESSGTWQDWQSATTQTSATFGPADPVTVQDEQIYYFRARARDRAGNVSTYAPEGDCSTHVRYYYVYLPLVLRNYPPLVVENGSFETSDFTGWQHGGELHQFVRTTYPHAGRYSALLGDPAYGNENLPVGSAWVYQAIQVPSTGSPILSFWYRIFTYDVLWSEAHQCYYDYFDVYIQDTNGQTLEHILRDGYTGTWEEDTLRDLGWKHFSYDLSGYAGQTIRITFANFNTPGATGDPGLNTYTYLDDVVVSR